MVALCLDLGGAAMEFGALSLFATGQPPSGTPMCRSLAARNQTMQGTVLTKPREKEHLFFSYQQEGTCG
jgi:hypothetical protein